MTEIDQTFAAARRGDLEAFSAWMGRVERPIRLSLRPYARAVDVEGVVQETLMRMWVFASDAESGRDLTGENASLRFAIGMARNLARNEARRNRRERYLPPEELPEVAVNPDPPPDPGLRKAIEECLKRVARRPLEALQARLRTNSGHDNEVARALGMTVNTFLQNIVRARQQLVRCLEKRGVAMQELLP